MALTVSVLGPIEARISGAGVTLRPRERHVLGVLALRPSAPTTLSEVVDGLWPDSVPASAAKSVQNHVARIRSSLGRDAIETVGGAYRLGESVAVDSVLLVALPTAASLVDAAAAAIAPAAEQIESVLADVRGLPFQDLPPSTVVAAEQDRLIERIARAREDLVALRVVLGQFGVAIEAAARLVSTEPFRERGWALLALALHRDGQRREALRVIARLRATLRDEIGVGPGADIVHLEDRLARDDPVLGAAAAALHLAAGGTIAGMAASQPAGAGLDGLDGAATGAGWADSPDLDPQERDRLEQAAMRADAAARRHGPRDARALSAQLDLARELRLAGDPRCRGVVLAVADVARAARHDELLVEAASEACATGPTTSAGVLDAELDDLVRDALERGPSLRPRARLAADATLVYSLAGTADRMRELFAEALRTSAELGDPELRSDVLSAAYVSLNHPDDWPLRFELGDELVGLAERAEDDDRRFQAMHLVFSNQLIRGDPLWRTTHHRHEDLAARIDLPVRHWMAAYQRACVLGLDGRRDEAEAIAEQMLLESPVAASRVLTSTLMIRVAALGSAAPDDRLVGDIDDVTRDQATVVGWRTVRAWLAALRGDVDTVDREVEFFTDRGDLPREMTWSGAATLLGRASARTGNADGCALVREWLAPHEQYMSWYGAGTCGPIALGLAEIALRSGDRETAARLLPVAQRLVDRLGIRLYDPDLAVVRDAVG